MSTETPRSRRPRRPTLATVLKQAERAGFKPAGATVTADGVTLTFGGEPGPDNHNSWDSAIRDLEAKLAR